VLSPVFGRRWTNELPRPAVQLTAEKVRIRQRLEGKRTVRRRIAVSLTLLQDCAHVGTDPFPA